MKINNELLAAYAEGNVSQEERKTVRQYLMENPQELESVAMMMDEDYDLEVEEDSDKLDDDTSGNSFDAPIGAVGGMLGSIVTPSLCMSAAAFAPSIMPKFCRNSAIPQASKGSFSQRLGNLLDELI